MYVLQRNGDVFEMRHETSETVPGPVVSAPLLWAGGTTGAGRRASAFARSASARAPSRVLFPAPRHRK